jgi:hypothetical protein
MLINICYNTNNIYYNSKYYSRKDLMEGESQGMSNDKHN